MALRLGAPCAELWATADARGVMARLGSESHEQLRALCLASRLRTSRRETPSLRSSSTVAARRRGPRAVLVALGTASDREGPKHTCPMSLASQKLGGFIGTAQPDRARAFYRDVLGLRLVAEHGFPMVFASGNYVLRVPKVREVRPQEFTVLGWVVEDMEAEVDELAVRGVSFLRVRGYSRMSVGSGCLRAARRCAGSRFPTATRCRSTLRRHDVVPDPSRMPRSINGWGPAFSPRSSQRNAAVMFPASVADRTRNLLLVLASAMSGADTGPRGG